MLQKKQKNDRWTPIRNGKIYCSPACGRGCTWAEHEHAVAEGKKLVGRLKGKGWHAVIHENLGWHYKAVSGPVSVHCSSSIDRDMFWCLMSDDPEDGSTGCLLWDGIKKGNPPYFKDPNEAVKSIVLRAGQVVAGLYRTVIAALLAAGMR